MKTIRIDLDVWREIEKIGKFNETANDVLRRVFKLPSKTSFGTGIRHATHRLSPTVKGGKFVLRFQDGLTQSWPLPNKEDKKGIRELRDKAVSFVRKNMGTYGQEEAVKKALTQAGYYLTK